MFSFLTRKRDETIRSLEESRNVAQNNARVWSERLAKVERANSLLRSDLLRVEAERDALSQAATHRDKLRSVLFDIMSRETPSANATVKRMAHMAREALGPDDQSIDLRGVDLANTKDFLAGKIALVFAFVWSNTPQGDNYWSEQNKRDEITPEARAILEASVRRAEGKS